MEIRENEWFIQSNRASGNMIKWEPKILSHNIKIWTVKYLDFL